MDISKPLVFDDYGIVRIGPMRVGFVPPSSITLRRENPRKMSDVEYEALRNSVNSLGFKSFLLAEELSPGHYGLVDGHHRFKVLLEKKMERIPIILLDQDTDTGMVDLAMLSFNVTGSPNGSVYVDFLRELAEKHGAEIVAAHVGIAPGMLEDLTSTMQGLMDQVAEGGDSGAMGNNFGGTAFVGRPIRIELTNTEETRQLLVKAREITKAVTDGAVVLVALTALVAKAEDTPPS